MGCCLSCAATTTDLHDEAIHPVKVHLERLGPGWGEVHVHVDSRAERALDDARHRSHLRHGIRQGRGASERPLPHSGPPVVQLIEYDAEPATKRVVDLGRVVHVQRSGGCVRGRIGRHLGRPWRVHEPVHASGPSTTIRTRRTSRFISILPAEMPDAMTRSTNAVPNTSL